MRQHAPAELDQEAAVRVDELGFMVVQDLGGQDELLALAATLPIARAAYDAAVRMLSRRNDQATPRRTRHRAEQQN